MSEDLKTFLTEATMVEQETVRRRMRLVYPVLAEWPYTIPMALTFAHQRGDEIVDKVPRYSSADHAANFATLVRFINRRPHTPFFPYFLEPLVIDPLVEELLRDEYHNLRLEHVKESIVQGYWRVEGNNANARIILSEPVRRSALHLVSHKADFTSQTRRQRRVIRGSRSSADLVLASGTNELKIFEEACPDAWKALIGTLGFGLHRLPALRALGLILASSPARWSTFDELWHYWQRLTIRKRIDAGTQDEFQQILEFMALTPKEAQTWGIQAPFLRLDTWYAAWFFVYHVLHPDLVFMSILVKRRAREWDGTVGAELANAGRRMAARLQQAHPTLRVAAVRRRTGSGDVDLAILDDRHDLLLVAEMKTVFDRFQTNHQLANFLLQRVNFPKALDQVQRAVAAINDGRWRISDLFAGRIEKPSRIVPMVLTWWDVYNPSLGTDNVVPCCNYRTFEHLLKRARGNLAATIHAIEELSSIYCEGVLSELEIKHRSRTVRFDQEIQTDVLPRREILEARLSRLALAELQGFATIDDVDVGETPGLGSRRFSYHE